MTTPAIMRAVIAALLPAAIAAAYERGAGALLQITLATGSCLAFEALCVSWRRQAVLATLADGTAVVTGIIIGLSLPPLTPWHVSVAAGAFAMVLAKHCYGGFGNNPFNPAMAGYALVLVSFPADFGGWGAAPISAVFGGIDAVSTPTPLVAGRLGMEASLASAIFPIFCAVGGIFLLLVRAADWRLPIAFLLGALVAGGNETLLTGGLMLVAFFVVTDPVTAAVTTPGKWLYGLTAGALTVWLRTDGQHADGIAFAVLICNMLAPLMDKVMRWR